jgi:hypothetical protein
LARIEHSPLAPTNTASFFGVRAESIVKQAQLQKLIMSRQEAAELLEVSGFTLDKWRRRGWLVPLNANYRGIAYAREDVEEFQRKHKAALYRREPGPKTVNPRIRPRRKEASV